MRFAHTKRMNSLLKQAKALQEELIQYRRSLHSHAEIGFDLKDTVSFVESTLKSFGYIPKPCGKAGVIATMGRVNAKKCILLRADMDALPIQEKSGETFACKKGNMHACGHDLHTAMLLGAAKLLKENEGDCDGCVKLLFQPAEETLEGANDVLKHGVLENPSPQAAMMLHVMTNTDFPTGTAIISSPGVSAPAADFFTVRLTGKGCHGSSPWEGRNPLSGAAHLILALNGLTAQEIPVSQGAVLTVGCVHGGEAGNVIPSMVTLKGTSRIFNEEERIRLKKRIIETVNAIAKAHRLQAKTEFTSGCPTLWNDEELSVFTASVAKELLGKKKAFTVQELSPNSAVKRSGGSEDFAYIAHEVPSIMMALSAGEREKGYAYPLHHPKARFDEDALYVGAALYAHFALSRLKYQ